MQKWTLFGVSILLMGVLACGEARTSSVFSQSLEGAESVSTIQGELGGAEVVLNASVTLDDLVVDNQQGWLLLSWVSEEAGFGTLSFPSQGKMKSGIQLSVMPGKSVLLLSTLNDVYRHGQVWGEREYSCGPQGVVCKQAIPEIRPEQLTFPCGPQGTKCQIVLP
jgi:hypothetical protein